MAASPEVAGRNQAWLSCSVLSPARRPVNPVTAAVCVVDIVVVKVAGGSTQFWFSAQPEETGRARGRPGARSRVENSWMLPLRPQRMFRAHIRCDQ